MFPISSGIANRLFTPFITLSASTWKSNPAFRSSTNDVESSWILQKSYQIPLPIIKCPVSINFSFSPHCTCYPSGQAIETKRLIYRADLDHHRPNPPLNICYLLRSLPPFRHPINPSIERANPSSGLYGSRP